jgi:histone H3/H4
MNLCPCKVVNFQRSTSLGLTFRLLELEKSKKVLNIVFPILSVIHMPKRGDIASAAVKRLLKEYSGDMRVSEDAAKACVKAVDKFLEKVGAKGRDILSIKKKKTLTDKDLDHVVNDIDCKLRKAGAQHKGGHRGLAQLGVERVVREKLGKDNRLSGEAGKVLVAYAEGLIRILGEHSTVFARNAKRGTIQGKDVVSALEVCGHM